MCCSSALTVALPQTICDLSHLARAAFNGNASAGTVFRAINLIVSVNPDAMTPDPMIDGKTVHGRYC